MQTSNTKSGLHPLLTAAAVSVTVLSAVGVGALTGVLPNSMGTTKDTTSALVTSAAQPAPIAAPAPAPEIKGMPPAHTVSTPAPKPAKKVVVARKTESQPVGNVTDRDFAGTPPPAPVVQAQVEAPKAPVAVGSLGIVESVREVSTPAAESNGVGPIAGGIAGAVIGNQFGNGMGRNVATVIGAGIGAFGGKEIEKRARATKHWEVAVRLDDGTTRTINSDAQPYWRGGERVRLLDGRLTPA